MKLDSTEGVKQRRNRKQIAEHGKDTEGRKTTEEIGPKGTKETWQIP